MHGHNISQLLYADGLLLLSTSENELQHNITMINEFCNEWGLSVNADKSKVMTSTDDTILKSIGLFVSECNIS